MGHIQRDLVLRRLGWSWRYLHLDGQRDLRTPSQNLTPASPSCERRTLLRAPGCRCLSAFHGGFGQVRTPQISGSHSSDICFALRRVRSTPCGCASGASLSMLQAVCLTPSNRHSSVEVRFRPDFVCFTPESGRGRHPRRRSQVDPKRTPGHGQSKILWLPLASSQ